VIKKQHESKKWKSCTAKSLASRFRPYWPLAFAHWAEDCIMCLSKRATILHSRRGTATRSDRCDGCWLSVRKIAQLCAVALTTATLAGCAQSPVHTSRSDLSAAAHQAALPTIKERHQPAFGAAGALPHDASLGVASFYTEGIRTASGERLNPNALTAAHPTLPFGTRLRITTVANGHSVVVRVNDRGPFIKGRAVDVSYSAAKQLGITERGVAKVKMEVVQ
jgi:rare lipoprotein A